MRSKRREEASKAERLTMGVERIDDPNHPRGYGNFAHLQNCRNCSPIKSSPT
jgi:hypothetical protein